jgi:hypothetical protein
LSAKIEERCLSNNETDLRITDNKAGCFLQHIVSAKTMYHDNHIADIFRSSGIRFLAQAAISDCLDVAGAQKRHGSANQAARWFLNNLFYNEKYEFRNLRTFAYRSDLK